jgi:acyl-CoA synthetase (AMP-forming)/AMP-acid ligase II
MIRELLERGAPSHSAIIVAGEGRALSYEQLRVEVDSLVSVFRRLGIQRTDRIAMALPNGLEMIVSFLAASIAGTAAPLNPAYKVEEFRFYLEDTNASALIVPKGGAEQARLAAGDRIRLIEIGLDDRGKIQASWQGTAGSEAAMVLPEKDDIALVLHTSGTTSRPKRVPLSHANLMTSTRNVAETYDLTQEDVSFCVMPLFHVHGLVASTLATLYTGGTIVVVPQFNPLSFWTTVDTHKVTWYSAVPTLHQMLLARAREKPKGAENLRFIRSCSAALAPKTMEELESKFGAPVLEAYGMTEAAHQMSSNPLPPGIRKAGSVGVGTGVRITVLDEHGNELPPGARGEVSIQGANVIRGYENNPEANQTSFTRGWFRTGDEGLFDDDGYITLVGRIKELINRGGEKISPREIDEVLLTHPAVSEAVGFGIPDRVYGEEVAAAVVLREPATEKELIAFCRSSLADFKCPKSISIVEAIPRTSTGKIQRRVVAEKTRKQ